MSGENPAVADRRYTGGCDYILQDSTSQFAQNHEWRRAGAEFFSSEAVGSAAGTPLPNR